MPWRGRFRGVRDRERSDPRFHIEFTWPSLGAMLIVGIATAGLCWLSFRFLPPCEWDGRGDYRIIGGVLALMSYPWLHHRLRRWSGQR